MTASFETAPRLCEATLPQLHKNVARPAFNSSDIAVGQVHLGVGAFFKAHLAPYTQTAIERAGGDWAIFGASLRSPEAYNSLAPQDNLFTATEKDGDGARARLLTVLRKMMTAPDNPAALIAAMAEPSVKIITATITEKGYCLDPKSSGLDFDHPDIRHDLAHSASPRTAVGLLAAALAKRAEAKAPVTILSCDNLPGNGALFQRAVRDFISEAYPKAAPALDELARFPSTMVDRITPAATDQDRREVLALTGLRDDAAVVTEPFTQWVIEDDFAAERPHWESALKAWPQHLHIHLKCICAA